MLQAAAKQSAAADAKPFNKKTSRVKELVDEIAEESEDEYAGLGGASDDDGGSDGERSDISNLLDDEAPDVREEDLVALMA
jgi:mediator of replication checkpoint protein 1